jgi:type III secretory pathway component EscV
MTTPITLADYQRAEREVSQLQAWAGLRVHAAVTVLIWAGVVLLNVFVTSGFPWSIFVILGTGLGVFFHWYGYRHTDADTRRRQDSVLQYAHTH